ncbi:phage portal protein family protein [Nakamurella leprariae]|uniref:Portal protein n=1 Tax=Nakamurella leprariae TaxID=2803911 RepID=A0A939C1K7_9ACTN|nr:hypothetical protein [Nakamurella leprariae]MBM9467259.1 hypothetical protein [Nakamurella leprariae]
MTAPLRPAAVPTGELGQPGNLRARTTTRGRTEYAPQPAEQNWELTFPHSVRVYDQMRKTDGQVGSALNAIVQPILDAPWDLDTIGVKADVARFVRAELGLPGPGKPLERRRRGQAGIVWTEHLKEALLCLAWGFAPFEQTYEVTMPGDPGHPDDTDRPVVHLRKLGARLPSTLDRIEVARDGGLVGIWQKPIAGDWQATWGQGTQPGRDQAGNVLIPVDRLVMYVNGKEGADWTGTSILRNAYKHWLIADQLIRVDAQTVERNGMGLPIVEYQDPADRADAEDMVQQIRAGATAGIAYERGRFSVSLQGVSGTVVDALPKITAHQQAITKSVGAMFLDLGHDAGARSLGETFEQYFVRILRSWAKTVIASTATEHIVRDLVERNWGPDEAYPRIVPGDINTEQLSPEQLKTLTEAGLLVADDGMKQHVRTRWSLPEPDPEEEQDEPAAPANPFQPEPEPVDPVTGEPLPNPSPDGQQRNPFQPVAAAQYAAGVTTSTRATRRRGSPASR